jgi:hypothetical protein
VSEPNVTLEYADPGPRGRGWYLIYQDKAAAGPFETEHQAQNSARGYSVTRGSPKDPEMRLVNTAAQERPFAERYLLHSVFAWLGYWLLTGLDIALRKLSSWVWQARWRTGFVLFDRPCPRCGRSLWREDKTGCVCRLVHPTESHFMLPAGAEITPFKGTRPWELRYQTGSRRELFHWARLHRFFGEHAIESLRHDDRLYARLKEDS